MSYKVVFSASNLPNMIALLQRLTGGLPPSEVDAILKRMEAMSTTMQSELDELTATVAEVASVNGSLKTLLGGIPGVIQKAVDEAVAKGATPDQLAALDALNAQLRTQVADMSAAVT